LILLFKTFVSKSNLILHTFNKSVIKTLFLFFSQKSIKMEKQILVISLLVALIFLLSWSQLEKFEDFDLSGTINKDAITKQKEIPKIIHQIWLGDPESRPVQWMDTWKNKNKADFQYVLWDNQKIDNDLNWTKDMRKIYEMEDLKGRSNIARLLILHQYGGIFIDEDAIYLTQNNKDLTRLIDKARNQQTNFFAAKEPNHNYLSNAVMGSTAGNPVLSFMLNKLEELVEGYREVREKMSADLVNGNGLLTKADMYNYHITLIPEVMFYPPTRKWQQARHIPNCSYMYNYNYSKKIEKDYV